MSAGAQTRVSMIKADPATPTTVPATPTMQVVNFSSADFSEAPKSKVSDHITGSRRTSDVKVIGFDVGGGYKSNLQYEASLNDEIMQAFLWASSWVDNGDGTHSITDGNTYQPFIIEEAFIDVSQFFVYKGMTPDVMTLTIKDQDYIKADYSFVGMECAQAGAGIGNAYTAATENPEMTSNLNISSVKIDNVAVAPCALKEWTASIKNNVFAKTGPGTSGACSTGALGFDVEGKITLYFSNTTMYNRMKNGTPFRFEFQATDDLGNKYDFLLPRCKVSTDTIPITGRNSQVLDNVKYMGLGDSTEGCAIKITKTPHA